MRVGTILDPSHQHADDFARGLAFGAAEADRSARLFGWRVERVMIDARAAALVDAVVLASDSPAPPDVPALYIVRQRAAEPRVARNVFHLATGDEGRAEWHPALERYGAGQLSDRYRAAVAVPLTAAAWLGWFAFKVLAESALRARSTAPASLRSYLEDPATHFDGHKGTPLRFDAGRRLQQPLYGPDGSVATP